MKINIWPIVLDHLTTLRDARTGRVSKLDIAIFAVMPILAGLLGRALNLNWSEDVHNVSVTFFGVFIALLLNIQVAVFAIFQRKWDAPADERLAAIQRRILEDRRVLLIQLNANISYLTLFSCFALVFFLLAFAQKWAESSMPPLTIAIYTHFLLTLTMIVKRSHALFQKEYRDSGKLSDAA